MKPRSAILSGLAALLLLTAAPGHAAETRFLAGFDDLPIMPELKAESDPLVFATGEGRVVETILRGPASGDDVEVFYAASLPELGWRPVGDGHYEREREQLRLEILDEGPPVRVLLLLTPR